MWRSAALAGVALIVLGSGAASAAGCMTEVERVSQQMGVSAPANHGGAPPAERPATTESRGVPPEASSRMTTGTPAGSGDHRSAAVQSLQAARAASAQGNEQECMAQLAKAQEALQRK